MPEQDKMVMVRIKPDMYKMFERRAKAEGRRVSEWLRWMGVQACTVPGVDVGSGRAVEEPRAGGEVSLYRASNAALVAGAGIVPVGRKKTAAEIAASISGVRKGLVEIQPDTDGYPGTTSIEEELNEADWEAACRREFGPQLGARAPRGWPKTWKERHEVLTAAKKEFEEKGEAAP